MKNLLKIGLLAVIISAFISACGDGDKAHPKTNADKPAVDSPSQKVDTVNKAAIDTAKKDTAKKQQ